MNRSATLLPPETFNQFFSSVYGTRWNSLLSALQTDEKQMARKTLFANELPTWDGQGEIPRSSADLLGFYVMDPASIEVANAVEVNAGDAVLDMCAAPGGKTLILAEALNGTGELVANEISEARRQRLKKVIQQYIPREVRESIFLNGKDGGRFAVTHPQHFDRVLVDAPCSGERHLLRNSKELSQWSESRSKKLAQRQYALLTAALLTCKPGGRVVYSTCSISPYENDSVIAELARRKEGTFSVEQPGDSSHGEKTEFGMQFLPDKAGWGPIYYSVLKVNES
jgi:16S rRNA C967 or C1407 C5-methylase (RsmB/RsmF family)